MLTLMGKNLQVLAVAAPAMDLNSVTIVADHLTPKLSLDIKISAEKSLARSAKCSIQQTSAWLIPNRNLLPAKVKPSTRS